MARPLSILFAQSKKKGTIKAVIKMTIEEIKEKIKQDPRNEDYTKHGLPPILQISEQARILIIGQAPGKKVEESSIPFNDASGVTLREWMGIDEQMFYSDKIAIMPMDFYYPGKAKTGDLPPRPFIAKSYHKQILAMMPHIQLTILVGNYATSYYLKGMKKKNLTETVRHYQDYLPQYFPIVHPSPLNNIWQKKNPWFKETVVLKLQEEVKKALLSKED